MIKYTVSTSLDAKTDKKKKSEVSPDIQHSVGFTGGNLNELENGVKCAKGQTLPKTALYFSLWIVVNTLLFLSSYSRILETVQNYAPLRSKCLLRPITHTTSFFWKCQFSWWIHPLFSKGEKSSPVSTLQIPRPMFSKNSFKTPHLIKM